jgi:hypothetical protein
MKTIKLLLTIFFIPTFGLAQHSKAGKTISRHEYISMANGQRIQGTWLHYKWTMYRTLMFDGSTVHIDNHVDTVMTNKYSISGDTLIIWVGQPDKPYKSKIITLTNDTLILQGILDINEIRGYSRKKAKK